MLDKMKQYASGWIAQLLIGLLVLSFAAFGISGFIGGGSNSVATVGNAEVSAREFQRRYNNAAEIMSRELGQELTPEQANQLGVAAQVLRQLVTEATLNDTADRLGLGISNETLSQKIAADPSLTGPTGVYDRATLSQIIAAQRMTEDEFILDRRGVYIRNQLFQAFGGGISAPDAYLQAAHEYRAEERDISYVVVVGPYAGDVAEPNAGDISAYYEAHLADWRAPEYRALRYFMLSPPEIADPSEVSDQDAKERYDRQATRFTVPEMRRVEQIVFVDRAEAEPAAAALGAGKTFDELVADRNLKPTDVDLGMVTFDQIVAPAVAEAAFGLPEAGVSAVVDGRFGPVILRVTVIEPAIVTTFARAKADLKREISVERAADQILDLHDAIEDARAGGATLVEVAARYELNMVTVAAGDASGKDADAFPVALPIGLLEDAFLSDVGVENNPVEPDRASYSWYEVTAVTAPRLRPLSEVSERIVTAWKVAEQQNALDAKAAVVKRRLEGNETIAEVAEALSLNIRNSEKVTRLTSPNGDLTAAVIRSAFEGPQGHAAIAAGPAPNARVVLVVNAASTPAYFSGAPELAQTAQQLSGQLSNNLLELYVAQLQSQTDIRLNQVAIQAALGLGPNQTRGRQNPRY